MNRAFHFVMPPLLGFGSANPWASGWNLGRISRTTSSFPSTSARLVLLRGLPDLSLCNIATRQEKVVELLTLRSGDSLPVG